MRYWIATSLWFTLVVPAVAQNQLFPVGRLRVVEPGTIEPLTAGEKATRELRNTFSPARVGSRFFMAGIDQWTDHPEEWPQGMEGYSRRVASRWGRMAVRNAIQVSSDIAFQTDPRYDRCACSGFRARTAHALKRVLIARRDYGGEMLSVSQLAGAYLTPVITDQWYPDRLNTATHKLTSGSMYLAWSGAGNMFREFWPDIKARVFRKR
jgi:hypothetical protein